MDNTSARFDVEKAIFDDGGSNRDGGVHIAIPGEIANGAPVDAPLHGL